MQAGRAAHAQGGRRPARRPVQLRAFHPVPATRGGAGPVLALHHRLDRETSGLVLFAKAREANLGLARQFAGRLVHKRYLAVVSAPAPPPPRREWVVKNRLAAVGTGRGSRMSEVANGGEQAETVLRVLSWKGGAALVQARPLTGRKHQVRAHLAGLGWPIVGDVRYGGVEVVSGLRAARTMLHAATLRLTHPTTGAPLALACNPPDDFLSLCRALGLGRVALEAGLTPPPRDR